VTGPIPDPLLLVRHKAAMKLIKQVAPEERLSLLVAVVAPESSEWARLLEERDRDIDAVAV
jgi:hypothetical protein